MTDAFLDASGGETPFGGEPYLVVVLLSTDRPRTLELAVTRVRRKYGASLASGEMKADASSPAVTAWLLRAIAAAPTEIVAIVLDKAAILQPPEDPRGIYRFAVAEAVRRATQRQPQLDLYLDKRYTSLKLRQLLGQAIRDNLAGLSANVMIRHEDSIMPGLEIDRPFGVTLGYKPEALLNGIPGQDLSRQVISANSPRLRSAASVQERDRVDQ